MNNPVIIDFLEPTTFDKKEVRQDILKIQDGIALLPNAFYGDSDNCPLKHSFAEGCYVREILLPKGTLVVGKLHKHSHPNFLIKGKVSVLTEEGIKHIEAPCSMISPAGTKRVVYAHEDSTWITVHVTNETDLEKIEDHVIAKDYNELDEEVINKFITELKTEK